MAKGIEMVYSIFSPFTPSWVWVLLSFVLKGSLTAGAWGYNYIPHNTRARTLGITLTLQYRDRNHAGTIYPNILKEKPICNKQ